MRRLPLCVSSSSRRFFAAASPRWPLRRSRFGDVPRECLLRRDLRDRRREPALELLLLLRPLLLLDELNPLLELLLELLLSPLLLDEDVMLDCEDPEELDEDVDDTDRLRRLRFDALRLEDSRLTGSVALRRLSKKLCTGTSGGASRVGRLAFVVPFDIRFEADGRTR